MHELLNILEIDSASDDKFIQSLPFSLNDVTTGVENELQTAVIGKKEEVDLLFIETGFGGSHRH